MLEHPCALMAYCAAYRVLGSQFSKQCVKTVVFSFKKQKEGLIFRDARHTLTPVVVLCSICSTIMVPVPGP